MSSSTHEIIGFSSVKAILGYYYCQIQIFYIPEEINLCQVVWKHYESHGGDLALN